MKWKKYRYVIKCTSYEDIYIGKDALNNINLVKGRENAYHFDYIYSLMVLHNIRKQKSQWENLSFKIQLVGSLREV